MRNPLDPTPATPHARAAGATGNPPRVVLGLADNHDAGACLVIDGHVMAAVSEERLDRVKNSGAFPFRAIDAVLTLGGIRPEEVEAVAVGSRFTPAAALRALRGFHHRLKEDASQFSYLLHLYILYQVALQHFGLTQVEDALNRPLLARALRRAHVKARAHLIDHHTAHAASAARTSPWDPCLVITLDAMGDGKSVTVHRSEGGRLIPLYSQSGCSAINTCYSRVTEFLGFRALRHEGKITGLAAYAEPPQALLEHFAGQLRFIGPGFSRTDYLRPSSKQDAFYQTLTSYPREAVAAAVQRNLELQVVAFVRHWVRQTGLKRVAVAGGVFANVKLNQRILAATEVEGLHIYPHMSDGGLPAGAAMLVAECTPSPIQTLYLGPDIGELDARRALDAAGLSYTRPEGLAEQVAELLANGKVVARASGRLEWGPRALGNRSILYRPDDRGVNEWLNEHLRRTEFMPFAPSTLWEATDSCYSGLTGARDAARFMTVCCDCTAWMGEHGRGVVHVDGTARPQLVRQEDNPSYYALLKAFEARTGLTSVINTSFNMHEEPIVCSAEDAVRGWKDAKLDALVLGPYLTERKASG